MLIETELFGKIDKVRMSISRMQAFMPVEGYYLAFSGGKDSVVLKDLAIRSGVKFDIHYEVTTIDPPELVYFIRQYHPDVKFELPNKPFFTKMISKGFPTRVHRWCCHEFKEKGGDGRFVLTGIRSAESSARSKRLMVETCYRNKTKRFLHPIIDWTESDIWEYIKVNNLAYCNLYDRGFSRIGCVLCPFTSFETKTKEILYFPRLTSLWLKAFRELYNRRKLESPEVVSTWENGDSMFDWWLKGVSTREIKEQRLMFV